jgi:hypothetical protein
VCPSERERAAHEPTLRRLEREMTSYMESEGIQSGWTVWTSDGQELGTVIGTDQTMIRVKKGGLMSKEIQIPRSAVGEVETGRVELNLTKDEAESQAH